VYQILPKNIVVNHSVVATLSDAQGLMANTFLELGRPGGRTMNSAMSEKHMPSLFARMIA
jgi:hypothetical protein